MKIVSFISSRFNARGSLPPSIRVMRTISMAGIAIAVAALVIASAIGRGFESRYSKALMDFNAHIVVMGGGEMTGIGEVMEKLAALRYDADKEDKFVRRWSWLFRYAPLAADLEDSPNISLLIPKRVKALVQRYNDQMARGIVGATPFLYREALSIGAGKIRGVVVKGIDSASVRDVNSMSIEPFDRSLSLASALASKVGGVSAIAGRSIARDLGAADGPSKIRLLIPREGARRGGAHQFEDVRIAGLFESGMQDYDAQFILMSLPEVRRLFDAPKDAVTGVELKLANPEMADAVAAKIDLIMGPKFRAVTWSELNRDLLSAVRLEKLVSTLIMGLMVVVAALNIVAVLVLITIYRFHEIAVLKALGLGDRSVRKILVRGGAFVGLIGVIGGLAVGLGLSEAVGRFNLVPLPAEIYLIGSLPIDISPLICGMIALFCLMAGFLTSVMAARRLGNIPVAEGLQIAR